MFPTGSHWHVSRSSPSASRARTLAVIEHPSLELVDYIFNQLILAFSVVGCDAPRVFGERDDAFPELLELNFGRRDRCCASRGSKRCEGVGDVVGVEAPLGGVAQVIFHGVQVVEDGVQVRVHQDRGVEEDGEGQVEVEREVEENQRQRHMCNMRMT